MDPLTLAIAPPPDESPEQKTRREAEEQEAKRVSEAIDEALKQERLSDKKKRPVKLLLLGQSESGKSTTLRQFQRLYTPTAFRQERALWRSVIQLNLTRSVRIILDALEAQLAQNTNYYVQSHSNAYSYNQPGPSSFHESRTMNIMNDDNDNANESASFHPATIPFSDHLLLVMRRLLPLRHLEALLMAKLAPPEEDEATRLTFPPPVYDPHNGHRPSLNNRSSQPQELFVRSNTAWKHHLSRTASASTHPNPHRPSSAEATLPSASTANNNNNNQKAPERDAFNSHDPTQIIHSCREDILDLWHEPAVREVLRRRKVRLEESPGFFLDDIERVTSLKYLPSEDDVLRARLKTVGVSEYRFEMELSAGKESGSEWRIYDVGGTRSQVPAWVPFFENIDAIIFLAPISAFDQTLVEDRTVNRLEDSVLMWKMICQNKMLSKVDLVLFLNKCDILGSKLSSGIRLAKYVRSYGERSNDVDTASKYFRTKFSAIQREYSPIPRRFYGYLTSVTDITTTSGILASVRDMIVREHLKQSRLI
ncbi:G-alpha-domain-containing protein [Sistotremastrum suecicum HHB10207 ss-3]|uniref:G-alpha-domain-containing protein n=1 Tax=Sistotremastrum suecicum HHB10207 ss-3 TaxID=1314776 RepID=A0A166BKJ0_9AGAM|nr:G-alpha-domain-containing protein [Sistotremastrum suecicum HHB10207 ss-3]